MHKETEDDWYTNLTEEHYLEVGRAVTEWGELEMLIYGYLEKYIPAVGLYEFLAKQMRNFAFRCDLLEVLVKSKAVDETKVQDLVENLKKAKKLADDRNLLAHNPMQFWLNDTNTEIVGGIVHSRTGRSANFDLAKVKAFTKEAHELRFAIMNSVLKAMPRRA